MLYRAVVGKRPAIPEQGYSRIVIRATVLEGVIADCRAICWREFIPDGSAGVRSHKPCECCTAQLLANDLRYGAGLFPDYHPGYGVGRCYSGLPGYLLEGIYSRRERGRPARISHVNVVPRSCWQTTCDTEPGYSRIIIRATVLEGVIADCRATCWREFIPDGSAGVRLHKPCECCTAQLLANDLRYRSRAIPGLSFGLRCWRALFPDYHPGYGVGGHYSRFDLLSNTCRPYAGGLFILWCHNCLRASLTRYVSVREKIEHQAVKLVGMFPLSPVSTSIENMHFRIWQSA
jgi:hypothetical protein